MRFFCLTEGYRPKQQVGSAVVAICLTVLTVTPTLAASTQMPALIPQPQKMKLATGEFHLSPSTEILADSTSMQTAKQLAAQLRPATGDPLKVETNGTAGAPIPNSILLTTESADTNLGPDGYELTVTKDSVVIRAPAPAGLFYGAQTLLQLLPPQVFSTKRAGNTDWRVPCVQIQDWPRFRWRGLMLDVSRHFFTKEQVEKLLDLMALYKLNTFQWHLVDNSGWRIQIRKYPRLTQVGAWRRGIGWGLDPKSSTAYGPDGRYGGYYTQKDIREVVAYAARRHITVVPEIEMPGHSGAALKAYPQLSCTDSTNRHAPYVYSPANPATFTFLEDVLDEVFRLFPGQYVHIGGDEVPMGVWGSSPACRALMKREGLKNERALQSWFTRRIEKFIHAHGKTLVGWSEIARGGLAPNAVVMDWDGGGKEAAAAGRDAVMTPRRYCYLNYYQPTNRLDERPARATDLPLGKAYSFEPIPQGLPPQDDSHILGAQAILWTALIASLPQAECMLFPRLCALAEVDWSSKEARNWPDFQRRVQANRPRLDELDVNYRR